PHHRAPPSFPTRRSSDLGPARSRALGLNGALMAAGFTTGAVLGGVLTGTVSWRWAFFINVVIAAAVLAVAPFVLREPPAGRRPKDRKSTRLNSSHVKISY